jgi:hypothetical protein
MDFTHATGAELRDDAVISERGIGRNVFAHRFCGDLFSEPGV